MGILVKKGEIGMWEMDRKNESKREKVTSGLVIWMGSLSHLPHPGIEVSGPVLKLDKRNMMMMVMANAYLLS